MSVYATSALGEETQRRQSARVDAYVLVVYAVPAGVVYQQRLAVVGVLDNVLDDAHAPNALRVPHIQLQTDADILDAALLVPPSVLRLALLVARLGLRALRVNKSLDQLLERVAVAGGVLADVGPAERALARLEQRLEKALVAICMPAESCYWTYQELKAYGTHEVVFERGYRLRKY